MSSAVMLTSALVPAGTAFAATQTEGNDSVYATRFMELYNTVKNDSTGYFDENGVPYHSIETLMVEAPDQGHESTSEAASYLVWLEAVAGELTGNYQGLEKAWDVVENYFIPTSKDQPGQTDYNPSSPATYASEYDDLTKYPSELISSYRAGTDPISSELKNAYGDPYIYGMHWLIDVDNFYGFGLRGQQTTKPVYINTYQRGRSESCFETVPQPCWEDMKNGGRNGYLDLFTKDRNYSAQWKYTNAPDADARLIGAMWNARNYAKEDGVNISSLLKKTSKMGDYLRYSMFDKYFMKIGAGSKTPASGRDAQHYLLSWYYAWGGSTTQSWSWRIGCSHSHFGYQSPWAAYILSTDNDFTPKASTGKSDWAKSLDRQIELYTWLQSEEGGIAGGCSNSYNGCYDAIPSNISTFYGMAYQEHPVYGDPGSNRWFGMQAWSMQRMCEYYYNSGDERVKDLVNNWANWAESEVTVTDKTFSIPSNLEWSGQPDTWKAGQKLSDWKGNSNLHVRVDSYGEDVGVAGSLANALLYVAAANQKYGSGEVDKYKDTAKDLLDCLYENYTDAKGVASEGVWDAASRFFTEKVYIPSGWTGRMPNGDVIDENATFLSIRSQYRNDPDFARIQAAYEAGQPVKFTYHRFWAQVEVAVANGVYYNLFEKGKVDPTPTTPAPTVKPTSTPTVKPSTPAPTVKPTSTPTVKPSTPAPTQTPAKDIVKVSISGNEGASSSTIGGQWTVTANSDVSLSDVKIRYYFTSDSNTNDVVYVDNVGLSLSESPWYAALTSSTNAKVYKMDNPTATADSYIEITFSGADYNLAKGNLQMGLRMAKSDWSQYNQSNDYSYTNGAVVLVGNQVVGGTMPQ